MKHALVPAAFAAIVFACSSPPPEVPVDATPPPVEIADQKYADAAKQGLAALSSGNIDEWMTTLSDNAKMYWSAGDSLIGKQAITDYWKDRRTNVIDSIQFSNHIFLPIRINDPEAMNVDKGNWLLAWYFVNSKYKNGQKVAMWIHTGYHFDDAGKVDQVNYFFDRAPIQAALAVKAKK